MPKARDEMHNVNPNRFSFAFMGSTLSSNLNQNVKTAIIKSPIIKQQMWNENKKGNRDFLVFP